MELDPAQAAQLARTLRDLRKSVNITQDQLAKAFSVESTVTSATISSWESASNPKTPPAARLSAYARFFATRRSLDGRPHLISEDELTEAERKRGRELEAQLLGLVNAGERINPFTFDAGPIVVICPDAPKSAQGPLALPQDPNFTKLHQFADLDAMIEIFGHLRYRNPALDVSYRLASEVAADDLTSHVILLGGIGWNEVTEQMQETVQDELHVAQVNDPDLHTGEPFVVDGVKKFDPTWGEPDAQGNARLKEDVGLLARLPNPYNSSRTLTICNGIHSRGVFGAVRCLTDHRVRDANERYLAERFPDGRFALLLKVSVIANETMTPDLQNPDVRLYEWPPANGVAA